MNVRTSPHPTDQTLNAYGLGKLEEMLADVVGRHLEQCAECQNRVSEMSADSFLDRVREAQDDSRTSAKGESRFDGAVSQPGANAVTPPAETLPPGLADHPDYAIKKELGRGGMGVVYLAHNSMMGRDEVLKVMGRQIMERPGVLDRFSREIRAVAKLRHPNIVTAYTAFRLNDSIVFAMEFVEGLDLAKMVKAKGALPVSHACNFIYQAALGLQHAHEEGMVHRDIKPGNLMIARKGDKATIKVLDFGLAKVTREEKVDGGLTSVGQALGTPDFIAPEQILDAQSADIRADIYSLGGTLYYLLTGRPPFKANSLYDIYQAHISRDADPLNLIRPEIPFELAALVSKMMAKEPSRRFQTPGEVAEALKPFFKKGATAFQGARAEVSRGDLDVDRPVAGSASQPSRSAGAPGGVGKKVDATVSEARWEGLVDLRDDESSVQPVVRTQPQRGWPPRTWAIGLTASLLGLVALGVIVITIKTEHGETRMVAPEGKRAEVEQGGVTVEVRPAKDVTEVQLAEDNVNRKADMASQRTKDKGAIAVDAATVAKNQVLEKPFIPLFNGKDMTGWKEGPTNTGTWNVADGILELRGTGAPGGRAIMVTERQDFANFRLRVKFRYQDEGHGQVEIRHSVLGESRNGYAIHLGTWPCADRGQILVGSIAKLSNVTYGKRVSFEKNASSHPVPLKVWNQLEITASNGQITTSVNGRQVTRYTDNHERHGSGGIALVSWSQSALVEYQEIAIQELPE